MAVAMVKLMSLVASILVLIIESTLRILVGIECKYLIATELLLKNLEAKVLGMVNLINLMVWLPLVRVKYLLSNGTITGFKFSIPTEVFSESLEAKDHWRVK